MHGGRVDLFACNLLGHPEGKEVFDTIETLTRVNFAASTDKTGIISHHSNNSGAVFGAVWSLHIVWLLKYVSAVAHHFNNLNVCVQICRKPDRSFLELGDGK